MRGKDEKVLAIFLADIHLSLKPPVWRSAEPDWMEAQKLVLSEVCGLQKLFECPVFCAGDIFDRNRKNADGWNAPAELINFAIRVLPDNIYAIPGQHDLPNHQYDDIERSAYWTLVKANKIKDIHPGGITIVNQHLVLSAFPPGFGVKLFEKEKWKHGCHNVLSMNDIIVAVVHDYIWIPGYSYPNAPDEKRIKMYKNDYGKQYGYDVIVYGDNHKGFSKKVGETTIFNCGTLMRRKSDEIDYQPQVGLLLESGEVIPHYLDTSQDKYITAAEAIVKETLEMSEFMDELEKLGKTALDFVDAMKEYMHRAGRMSSEAKQIILNAMEKTKK